MDSPEKIRHKTLNDYSWIADEATRLGPDSWRENICHPIFDPVLPQYLAAPGYEAAANLGLGCAIPPLFANLQVGEKVVDLGCAAGIDAFIARTLVGETGWVTGVDLTPALINRARAIASERGFPNIDFEVADITNLPLTDQRFDVATSNGVFSLIPDKYAACKEIYRVLKPGGRFILADLMRLSDLPVGLYDAALQFTGCFNGIYLPEHYREAMQSAGFEGIEICDNRMVALPSEMILPYFSEQELEIFEQSGLAAVVWIGYKS